MGSDNEADLIEHEPTMTPAGRWPTVRGLFLSAAPSFAAIRLFPNMPSLWRESFWVVFGQGVASAGGLVGVGLLIHALPSSEYGRFALSMTVVTLGQILVFGPVSGAGYRFFSGAVENDGYREFSTALFRLFTRSAKCYVGAVLCGVLALVAFGGSSNVVLLLLAATFGLAAGFGSMLDALQSARRNRRVVAWHDSLSVWTRYLLAMAACRAFSRSSEAAMAGFVAASLVTLASQGWFFDKLIGARPGSIEPGPDAGWPSRLESYAAPFFLWGGFSWLQSASEEWSLNAFTSNDDVARHAVFSQFGYYPITVVSTLLLTIFQPIAFQHAGLREDEVRRARAHRICWRMAFCTLGASGVLAIIAALIFRTPTSAGVLPEQYRATSWLLPLFMIAAGFFYTGQALSVVAMADDESARLLSPKITVAVAGILGNLLGAYCWGLRGVAYSMLWVNAVYAGWMFVLAWRCGGKTR